MAYEDHIIRYLDGPSLVRAEIEGLTDAQLKTRCEPGKWSIHEVVCHLTDFEIVYADRIKRSLAEDRPTLFGGDPDAFCSALTYDSRSLETELQLMESTRRHVAEILKAIPAEAWEFTGQHSERGLVSVLEFVEGITNHIPHHLKFVAQKKERLSR
jgi:hypothetical protein